MKWQSVFKCVSLKRNLETRDIKMQRLPQQWPSKSSPFITGEHIYFQGTDDRVWKVDINTGMQDPSFNPNGSLKSKSTPVVVGDYIYIQGIDDRVWKSNVKTNAPDSKFNSGGEWHSKSAPAVVGEYVYFQGTDDRVWKVDVNTGKADPSFNSSGSWKSKSTPVVVGDYIYIQGTDDRVWKVNVQTSAPDSKFNSGGEWHSKSAPAVVGEYVYFQGTDDRVWKVDVNTGKADANFNSSGSWKSKSTPVVVGDYIYIQGTDDRVWKSNVKTGAADSKFNSGGEWHSKSAPVVVGEYVYFQGTDDRVWKVDTNDAQIDKGFQVVASSWMSYLDDNCMFGQISIPGTHDAAAYNVPANVGEAQDWDIITQLNNGIRFLDIRIVNGSSGFNLRHGFVPLGDFEERAMAPVNHFLQENPSELVIMSIKNEDGDIPLNKQSLEDNFIYSPDSKFYSGIVTGKTLISERRGQIVLADRYDTIKSSGFLWKTAAIQDEYKLSCESSIAGVCTAWDYPKKGRAVIDHFQAAQEDYSSSTIYVNFLSAATPLGTNIGNNAKWVNQYFLNHIRKIDRSQARAAIGSIFPMDYPNRVDGLIEAIYRLNFVQ